MPIPEYVNQHGQKVIATPRGVLTEKEAALLYLYEGAVRVGHGANTDRGALNELVEWQGRVMKYLNGWKP